MTVRPNAHDVSVVIPTCNGEKFLRDTVESVFRQTVPPRELIAVDDHSTDGTHALLVRLAGGAPVPFHVERLDSNSGGPARPLNRALARAQGSLVAVLDQDDVLLPHHLDTLARLLMHHPEALLAFGTRGSHGQRRDPGLRWQARGLRRLVQDAAVCEDHWRVDGRRAAELLLTWGNYVVGYPGFVFRREAWQRKGGLDETLRVGSDFDLLLSLCLHGPVVFVTEPVYLRREHGDNLSARDLTCGTEGARLVVRYLELVAGPGVSDGFWRDLARQYLQMLARLAWAGARGEAARRWRHAARFWPWSLETPRALARHTVIRTLHALGQPPRSARPGELAELLGHLDVLEKACDQHLRAGGRGA